MPSGEAIFLGEDLPRLLGIERNRAAEEGTGVHVAHEKHDIGESRLAAAKPVTDRPRPRAGARRPHARHAGRGVERDDAAAAGADGDHLDLRRHIVIAVDHRLAGVVDGAALDHADLEGRASHVAGDDVLVFHQPAEMAAADDACGGAAFEHAHRPGGRFLGRKQAAIALHHQERPVIAAPPQQRLQAGDVLAGDLPRVSIDDRGGGALVFARHRRDFARQRDVNAGRNLADQVADAPFVAIVVEGPEEGDRKRLDLVVVHQRANRLAHRLFVQLAQHRALVVHPLRHAPGARARHQRRSPVGRHRVLDAVLGEAGPAAVGAARDRQRVLEAFGGDQAGLGAGAGEQRVVHNRRAVHEERRLRQQRVCGKADAVHRSADGGEHAVREVGRGRECLAEAHRLASGEQHRVRTGAADIGRDHIAGVALFAHLLPFVCLAPSCRAGTRNQATV